MWGWRTSCSLVFIPSLIFDINLEYFVQDSKWNILFFDLFSHLYLDISFLTFPVHNVRDTWECLIKPVGEMILALRRLILKFPPVFIVFLALWQVPMFNMLKQIKEIELNCSSSMLGWTWNICINYYLAIWKLNWKIPSGFLA